MERAFSMRKICELFSARPVACGLAFAAFLALVLAAQAESFDTPLRERVIDLGRSPYSNGRSKLTCDYFASFMVKQLDLGGEGADWIAIAPERPGYLPACTRAHRVAEKVIQGRDWCGYFQGAKGGFVFLSACSAYNGGLDFAVYDALTGTKVFQDTAVNAASGGLQFRRAPDGTVSLLYSRVAVFDCTLPRDQAGCWSQIESKLGLENAAAPVCVAYEKQMTGSVIAYPVEVALSAALRVRAVPGEIRCWPPE